MAKKKLPPAPKTAEPLRVEKTQAQLEATHHEDLALKYGLMAEHPQTRAAYSLAWSYGHSAGLSEVESYYSDLADLLKVAGNV